MEEVFSIFGPVYSNLRNKLEVGKTGSWCFYVSVTMKISVNCFVKENIKI